jgi:hypothetical protein
VHRLVRDQPDLWGKAIDDFVQSNAYQYPELRTNMNCSSSDQDTSDRFTTILVDRACTVLQRLLLSANESSAVAADTSSIHAELYRHVLNNYIRYDMPVFYMPDELILRGRSLGFYFFEPRYRRLIWQVMEPYPVEFRQGRIPNAENGIANPPMFIYAHKSPLKRGVVACLVQVKHCIINPNGTANIEVVPVEHVRVEKVYEQMHMNDHLYFAKVLRMRKEEQDFIELRDFQRIYPSLSLT